MKKFWSIFNLTSVIGIIYWNYLAATGFINNQKMGQLSDEINSLFTPAGYAFSIWSVIYLALLVNAVWYVIKAFKNEEGKILEHLGPWLSFANVASGFWLWFWLNEQFALSVLFMLLILISLLIAIVKLNMERWDAPATIIGFVWWPVCLYSGWITVATVTNISAYLKVNDFNWLFSEPHWAIILIGISTAIYLYMLWSRYMREFAAVGMWAFIAIAVRHWGEIQSIANAAILATLVLAFFSALQGFKYRKSNPFFKMVFGG